MAIIFSVYQMHGTHCKRLAKNGQHKNHFMFILNTLYLEFCKWIYTEKLTEGWVMYK